MLLERDAELCALDGAIGDARAGTGRLMVVEGAAGTGKSSLLAAACERASAAGLRVLRARGGELEREFAFGAVRQVFEPALAAAAVADRERLLAGAARPAEWVVLADPGPHPREHAAAGFAALHAIYWLASNLAVEQPLLVAVDDLHWLDASSLRALSYLARRVGDLPLTLLVALRPAEPGAPAALLDELRTGPGTTTLRLAPLGQTSVAAVVRARLAGADDEVCATFHAASSGNPLYVHELLRTLTRDGPLAAASVRDASVASVGERVARRVAALAPEAPVLTAAMAVFGDGGRLADAAVLAAVAEPAAARIARELKRIEILAAEDPFAFVHPLVRRSVYEGQSVSDRDAAHLAAAELLRAAGAPAEAVAAHLAAVRPSGSTIIATALAAAAREALGRAAPEAAIRWLARALDEQAHEPARVTLLTELGMAEVIVRDAAAVTHLEEALACADGVAQRARITAALCEIMVSAGQWEAGTAVAGAALAEVGDADPDLRDELGALWAGAAIHDPRLVDRFDDDSARFHELAAGESWAAHALSALLAAVAAHRGEVAQVVPHVEQALRDGTLLEVRGDAGAWATPQLLSALVFVDELDRALAAGELAGLAGQRSGSLIGTLTGPACRGWVAERRGDLATAEAELRGPLALAVEAGMPMLVVSCFLYLQEALIERPSLADVAALVEATDLAPAFLATFAGAILLLVRGRLRLARNERAAGIADLRASGATWTALGVGPTVSTWRSHLALALTPQQRDEATVLVEEEIRLARATGLPRLQGVAQRAAGLIEGGDDGIERLRDAVALLARSPARLEHARALAELGAALRRRGHRVDARAPLAEGMDLAHRCGAPLLVARAGEELRAAGARPRRIALSGVDALTASELRIARLAAEGRSNPEIAQHLFVSLKTVETHLSHAYAKLGVTGHGARAGLARALADWP